MSLAELELLLGVAATLLDDTLTFELETTDTLAELELLLELELVATGP